MIHQLTACRPLARSQTLHQAVVDGDLDTLRRLVAEGGEMVVYVEGIDRPVPALHFLAAAGHVECLEFLAANTQGDDLNCLDGEVLSLSIAPFSMGNWRVAKC